MSRRAATDTATKAAALQRAAEVGDAKAAEEFGVKAGTIRSWRSRLGITPPAGMDPADWALDSRELSRAALISAGKALKLHDTMIDAGNARAAQAAATSHGIMVEKAEFSAVAAYQAELRDARLQEAHGQTITAVMGAFLGALGIPASKDRDALLSDLLRQAGGGQPIAPSPAYAAPARDAVRAHFAAQIAKDQAAADRERLSKEGERREPLGLPAPSEPSHPDGPQASAADGEAMAAPVKRSIRQHFGRVVDAETLEPVAGTADDTPEPEPTADTGDDVEVVEGEVMPEQDARDGRYAGATSVFGSQRGSSRARPDNGWAIDFPSPR